MKSIRTITIIFFTVGLSALAGSLAKLDAVVTWPQWLFAVYFLLCRLTMFLDDLCFFKAYADKPTLSEFGFLSAVVAWFLWLMCALLVSQMALMLPFLCCAILISTFWVATEKFTFRTPTQKKPNPNREAPREKTDEEIKKERVQLIEDSGHAVWLIFNLWQLIAFGFAYAYKWQPESIGVLLLLFTPFIIWDGWMSGALHALSGSEAGESTSNHAGWEAAEKIITVFFTIGVSALGTVFATMFLKGIPVTWSQWVLALFLILVRLKMFLDHLAHYKKPNLANTPFQLNFIIGVISWCFWAASAILIKNINESLFCLIIAIFVSTLWIICERGRHGAWQKNHLMWLFFNSVNFTSLTVILFFHPDTEDLVWLFLVLCTGVVANAIKSTSLKALDPVPTS
jgi:hypothetical protein